MREPVARTPRSDMHRCLASITTPTPLGARCSNSPSATCWVYDARELGQPEDALTGQVTDVGDPVKGQQMVLARRVHRDASGEHHLVVALVVGKVVRSNSRGLSSSA